MIYLSLLHTLRSYDIDYEQKHEIVSDALLERHEAVDLLDLLDEINDTVTFGGLFKTLDEYKDVYVFLGVGDSLIRERVFEKLAEIMEVDYGYIYDQWLKGA